MIECFIKIGEGEMQETAKDWGMYYYKSDTLFAAPLKPQTVISFPEEEGEHSLDKRVDDAFDYHVDFFVSTKGGLSPIANANAKIAAFNKALYTQQGDIKQYKQITLYNDRKRAKIVGIPEPVREVTDKDFYKDERGTADAVVVGLTIRVKKPSLCDFNYSTKDQNIEGDFNMDFSYDFFVYK